MKKIIFGAALLLASSAANAQALYSEKDSLFCVSEQAWDRQYSYLSQGIKKLVEGCYVTDKKYRVVLLNGNFMSPSKFEIVELGQAIWADNGDVSSD